MRVHHVHDMITQRVGVTSKLPGTVPSDLPHSGAGPHEWNYMGRTLYHKKQKREFPDHPDLDGLTPGQTVGLLVTSNGQLHLFLDGQHRTEIASGLPANKPLWGAADVFDKCTKIKSEILIGESGGVHYVCINEHDQNRQQVCCLLVTDSRYMFNPFASNLL